MSDSIKTSQIVEKSLKEMDALHFKYANWTPDSEGFDFKTAQGIKLCIDIIKKNFELEGSDAITPNANKLSPKVVEKDFFDDLEKWENSFYCNECGCDKITDFHYSRTVANGEVWCCRHCKSETVAGDKPKEENY